MDFATAKPYNLVDIDVPRLLNSMVEDRVHRRLAAVLAADVVGYSRLMGVDEAGTLAALRAVWAEVFDPLVAGHRGRLAKKMGDGALRDAGLPM